MTAALRLVDDPDQAHRLLSPLRRRLIDLLREPASATEAAARLGLSRQNVNYHLRLLEREGLVELVELRARRGCTERIVRTTADAFVLDPALLGPGVGVGGRAGRDQHAAEHLVEAASRTIRDVSRMQATARRNDQRLLTFTVETEVGFGQPSDVHRFTDELAAAIARVIARFDAPHGRRYRVVVGGHPAPKSTRIPRRSTAP